MNVQIGHNNPPLTAFEEIKAEIDDLYDEAKLWLDGEPVATQDQADALNTLESKVRDAAKRAEALRKEEVKPFDEAKAEVQQRFAPLIADTKSVTGKTVMALDAIKQSLKPYLLELDRKKEEEAQKAREEAERLAAEAQAAMQSRETLEDREKAEQALAMAKEAEQLASKAGKDKAQAKGAGRATGLRKVWRATMLDGRAAAQWAWKERNAELMEFLQDQADKAVRAGSRSIEGFEIKQHKEL